jgi:molecular chaperone DnaK
MVRLNRDDAEKYAPWAAGLAILIAGAVAASGVPDAAPHGLPAGRGTAPWTGGATGVPGFPGASRPIRADLVVVEQNSPIVAPDGSLAQALGIVTVAGVFTPILGKGEAQPATRVLTFGKASAGPTSIELQLMRGDSPRAAGNHPLGQIRISVPEPNAEGRAQAAVIFRVADGVIVVAAINPVSRQSLRVEVVRPEPGR